MAYPQKSGSFRENQCTDDMVSARVAEIKELKEDLLPRLKEQVKSVVITTSLMRPGDRNKVQRFQKKHKVVELEDDDDEGIDIVSFLSWYLVGRDWRRRVGKGVEEMWAGVRRRTSFWISIHGD